MSKRQPNVLVFLTDDHGQWAMGCYGNPEIRSPRMDRLASEGVRFTNAFTTCPVCSPARASFWTGLMPSEHGIHDWLQEWHERYDHPGLAGQRVLAQDFHDAGYQTALIGKWHCGNAERPAPGFDRWFTHVKGFQYPHKGEQRWVDQDREVLRHGHMTDVVGDEAMNYLAKRDRHRPFFLCVGQVSTHAPFADHPEALVEPYRSAKLDSVPHLPAHAQSKAVTPGSLMSLEDRRERLAQYFAAVEHIDQQMGRLIDRLAEEGELDNTLIVYTADHGHMCGQNGLWGKGNSTSPQNFLEWSIRVPLLLRWPGSIPAGLSSDATVNHLDTHAMLSAIASGRLDAARAMWAPADQSGRDLLVAEYGNARMARSSTTKLVEIHDPANPASFTQTWTSAWDEPIDVSPAQRQSMIDAMRAYFDAHTRPGMSGLHAEGRRWCSPAAPWLSYTAPT